LGVIMLAALLPAIPLSLVFKDLVDRSWSPTFLAVVEQGLDSGLVETRASIQVEKQRLDDDVDRIWNPMLTVEWDDVVVLDEKGQPDSTAKVPSGMIAVQPDAGEPPLLVDDWLFTTRSISAKRSILFARPLTTALGVRAEEVKQARSLLRAVRIETERGAVLRSYIKLFLLATGLSLILALIIAALFAERLTRPLVALSDTARRVGEGDLNTRVTHRAGGEIGDLISSFNAMIEGLSDQHRELAKLEKMAAWRGMARILAHEIKNPLTPILLAVQEARRSDPGDHADHTRMLDECETIVTEEVEGLRNLVRSFSDFARMPKPDPMVDDLGVMLDDLGRLYGERLKVARPEGEFLRSLDHPQIRRALINLIDNGLAANRRAGRDLAVSLTFNRSTDHDVVKIIDQGDGIPPENIDRVFEPDFTTSSQGMGLGLPIVLGIVEAHGGSLAIATEPGHGTTFTLTLPRLEEASP